MKQASTTWKGLEAAYLVMSHYNRTETWLIRLNDGHVEKTKQKTRIKQQAFRHSNITPTCLQAGKGTAPGKRGRSQAGPGGDTGQWPERVLNPATASKGRQVPVSSATQPHCPLLPAEPGRAQDTQDPGLALPRQQEQPAHAGTRAGRATLRPQGLVLGASQAQTEGCDPPAETPTLLSRLTLSPRHGAARPG